MLETPRTVLLDLEPSTSGSLNSRLTFPFCVPSIVRHPYKKDPKRDPTLENCPSTHALCISVTRSQGRFGARLPMDGKFGGTSRGCQQGTRRLQFTAALLSLENVYFEEWSRVTQIDLSAWLKIVPQKEHGTWQDWQVRLQVLNSQWSAPRFSRFWSILEDFEQDPRAMSCCVT